MDRWLECIGEVSLLNKDLGECKWGRQERSKHKKGILRLQKGKRKRKFVVSQREWKNRVVDKLKCGTIMFL